MSERISVGVVGLGCVAVALLGALVPAASAKTGLTHTRTGQYQGWGDTIARDAPLPGATVLDENGIPMVQYDFGTAYNPVSVAQWGLVRYSLWFRYGDKIRLKEAVRGANWFVRTQRRDGTWRYGFPWTVQSAGTLPAGWSSALAQGQAVSLLRRVHHATGKRKYMRAARRGIAPLEKAPLLVDFHGRFFEEYPTPENRSLVLNGHMQTLLGLYDMSDRSIEAAYLYKKGRITLRRILPLYDQPDDLSLYAYAPLSGGGPWTAPLDYHMHHIKLLRILNRLKPNRVYRRFANRWEAQAPSSSG